MHSTVLPGSGQRRHAELMWRRGRLNRAARCTQRTRLGELISPFLPTPLLFPRRSRRRIREPASDWPKASPSPHGHCGTAAAAKGLCRIGSQDMIVLQSEPAEFKSPHLNSVVELEEPEKMPRTQYSL